MRATISLLLRCAPLAAGAGPVEVLKSKDGWATMFKVLLKRAPPKS